MQEPTPNCATFQRLQHLDVLSNLMTILFALFGAGFVVHDVPIRAVEYHPVRTKHLVTIRPFHFGFHLAR